MYKLCILRDDNNTDETWTANSRFLEKTKKKTLLSVQNAKIANRETLSRPNRQTRNSGIRWKMRLNSRQIPLTRRPRQMCKVTLKFRYSLERFYHRGSICCCGGSVPADRNTFHSRYLQRAKSEPLLGRRFA